MTIKSCSTSPPKACELFEDFPLVSSTFWLIFQQVDFIGISKECYKRLTFHWPQDYVSVTDSKIPLIMCSVLMIVRKQIWEFTSTEIMLLYEQLVEFEELITFHLLSMKIMLITSSKLDQSNFWHSFHNNCSLLLG